ncbi:non-ribosomal peptide synthetase [Clostridium cellulovorans]|uniref:Amino acid adenylation domain protein n=1 Tax=Clostridium cellulovorans (strain ATCC 35296 / DSM 3052 / OCM 3 / 743B) TaxID=573061 RepID=D9SLH4_CLOC7|nr:non-ribosomal peptide synthetase [Clostridium cellulovorans]ADL53611.1 amino acid adenylation domain protein [Clostridium cellulovorans 743B]
MAYSKIINKKDVEEILPLTSLQEGMLFHYLNEPKSQIYFEQLSISINGEIDFDIFKRTWEFIAESNEALRTIIRWQKLEKPLQIVLKKPYFDIQYYDYSNEEITSKEDMICKLKLEDREKGIDISIEPFRILLCKISDLKYEMIISNHHILYDGWSNGIIIKEFFSVYNDFYHGKNPEKIFKSRFSEYISWMKNQDKEKQKSYWNRFLESLEIKTLEDSIGKRVKGDPNSNYEIGHYSLKLERTLYENIKELARENNSTVASVLYSVWGLLLSNYNNSADIVFGTTVSGRNIPIRGIENMTGLFINTLPLRVQYDDNRSFQSIIKDVENSLIERRAFEVTSLVEIKDWCMQNNASTLFDTLVVVENYPLDKEIGNSGVLTLSDFSLWEATDFNLSIGFELFDELVVTFAYNKCLYPSAVIERMSEHIKNILEKVVISPDIEVGRIEYLSEAEANKMLYGFNRTELSYQTEMTISELFQEQVKRTPNNIAVKLNDDSLTYEGLNSRANQLANQLKLKGVKSDQIVAIMMTRSVDMIVAMLAVMKAGGAYLPLDPTYPKDRINYILDDSNACLLLTNIDDINDISFNGEILDIHNIPLNQYYNRNLEQVSNSSNLAYVIYTSGSTGNPKGVMIEHKSVNNFIQGIVKNIIFNESSKILALTTISFDIFVLETLLPLTKGSTVILCSEDQQTDPRGLHDVIIDNDVNMIQLTPSRAQMITNDDQWNSCLKNIDTIMVGGEAFPQSLLEKLKIITPSKIFNMYGPTETTVWSLIKELTFEKEITIGTPISNTRIYILDKNEKLCHLGVYGELCIAGDGLARGYLNKPELTSEKFIKSNLDPDSLIYKTGDVARWLENGEIEFIGRVDHQVKIRGYRIELGDIENNLLKIDGIKEAAARVFEDSNSNKYICGYYTGEQELSISNIKEQLLKELPEYMVPSFIVRLEKLPLTPNKKVDRKALPEPNGEIVSEEKYEAPSTLTEYTLQNIWNSVLGRNQISINSNFFEIGGHSLKATMLVSKINKQMDIVVPVKAVFTNPTIKSLSKYVEALSGVDRNPIKTIEKREYYPLSASQKRMFVLWQIEPESTAYNMTGAIKIQGALDLEKLNKVFKEIINTHESLRTSFTIVDGKQVQYIHENVDAELDYIETDESELPKILQQLAKPFNLAKAPLIRSSIIKVQEEQYVLFIDMHHIISDGMSLSILFEDFINLYRGVELSNSTITYKDYCVWQEEIFNTDEIRKQENYWMNILKDDIPVLNMPLDYIRPSVQSFEGDVLSFSIDKELSARIKNLSNKTSSTNFMTLLAAYNILLHRYTSQEDIIIGTPVSGRHHAGIENVVGMFVNTLPMRNKPMGEKTFRAFLDEVRINVLEAFEAQDYQFEDILNKIGVARDLSRNPIFDTVFAMQNAFDEKQLETKDMLINPFELDNKISKFDLTLSAQEDGEIINFKLEYCTSLYKRNTIERISRHFINILDEVSKNPEVLISDIDIMSADEKNQVIYEFNDMKSDYLEDKTIQELFEMQVQLHSNKVAVSYENETITYGELNQKAEQLAKGLREKGIKAETIVALMVERSISMVVGMLGIMKAGGVYLPIDPKYPEERIKFILEDSGCNYILCDKQSISSIDFDGTLIDIDDSSAYDQVDEPLEIISKSTDVAYIIFTSGSTGKPKGAMIEHKGVASLREYFIKYIGLNDEDNILQFASSSFDASLLEMFMALLTGATLVIAPEYIISDYRKFEEFLNDNNVTAGILPPNYLLYLEPERVKTLRILMTGGSAISPSLMEKWKNELQYINAYGPTEATICSTMWKCQDNPEGFTSVPIGKPIYNADIYILGEQNRIQPIGVPGELCVSGVALARGYLNRAELTQEKFVENPFNKSERMYRTGDYARWLPDGNIEFVGRIDNQVKIRGYRIEIGEIEKTLLENNKIKDATAIVIDDSNGDKHICAYYVAEEKITVSELREFLSKYIPSYMIPSYFIGLDSMPINQSGKIDKKLLPKPDEISCDESQLVLPENDTEEKLLELWKEVLDASRLSTTDNFFEVGGHSLKASVLISKINRIFNTEVPLKVLFKGPTIKELAIHIDSSQKVKIQEIKPVDKKEYYPLSSAQKRIYLLCQLDKNTIAYNIPNIFKIQGDFNKEKFEAAVSKLVQRHEALRTSFKIIDGEPVQIVHDNIDYEINYFDGIHQGIEQLTEAFVQPFDFETAPLFRVGVVKQSEDCHLLLLDVHHIIFDGVSMVVFARDLAALYSEAVLEPLEIGYKDYALWQKNLYEANKFESSKAFFINMMKDYIPVLDLPTDFIRPSLQSFEGANIKTEVYEELSSKLRELAVETNTTLYMVLLSAFYILLYRYTSKESIVIGTPVAGRNNEKLHNLMGMFVNTLVLKAELSDDKSFFELLQEVKENVVGAFDNQNYQFEELIEDLNLPRDLSRNPVFDVMFSLFSVDDNDTSMDGLNIKPLSLENEISKFDITLAALEMGKNIEFTMEYSTKLFKKQTIERMMKHYINLLEVIVDKPKALVSDIDINSSEESEEILYRFNNTETKELWKNTIINLFEDKVQKYSENVALVYSRYENHQLVDKTITYKELNGKINDLAKTMRKRGIKSGEIVPIIMERSAEMILSILAILKAGAAYLSIDPSNPVDRIDFIVKDCGAKIVVAHKEFGNLVSKLHCDNMVIDSIEQYEVDAINPDIVNSYEDLAYIIYTSGSTGMPKGVMVSHHNVVNIVDGLQAMYPVEETDAFLFKTTYTFDVSVAEIFGWFHRGGRLVILEKESHKDPFAMLKAISKYNITHVNFVPSMLNTILEVAKGKYADNLSRLKYVIVAGEAITKETVFEFKKRYPQVGFKNLYGPTEATIYTTAYDLGDFEEGINVPIGKPVQNMKTYVLDKRYKIQPVGVPGELYIGGIGVAKGYLNRPDLNYEKFIDNPFAPGEKIYKTGDLVKWLPDGNIEFLGRLDYQVKIRGFRIELGEIESLIRNYPSIQEAIVLAVGDDLKEKYLCAYYISDEELNLSELKTYLGKNIPEYMIPKHYIKLDKMPLNNNGKIDRKALPLPKFDLLEANEFENPREGVESKLALIWEDVLNTKQVGRKDNFFELGGHSLKAALVVGRIFKEFSVEISLADIFRLPVLWELAENIEGRKKAEFRAIEKAPVMDYYPLSFAQRRMYLLWEFDRESTAYNIPGALKVTGKITRNEIEAALEKVILKHEILRTSFVMVDGMLYAKINDNFKVSIDYQDISCEDCDADRLIKDFVTPFNLNEPTQMNVKLCRMSDIEQLIIFNMHHIICDGVSFEVIVEEFISALKGINIGYSDLQYKDFALWESSNIGKEKLKKQQAYWKHKLSDEIQMINITTDFQRESIQSYEAGNINFSLDSDLTKNLEKLIEGNEFTLYSVLLSTFNVILYKYTGQTDIIVGSPVAGRTHPDLEKMIGMFVNMLPLRTNVDPTIAFLEYVKLTHNDIITAFENQDYPIEELKDQLNINGDQLYNVVFSMQKVQRDGFKIDDVDFIPIALKSDIAKFDITLIALDKDSTIDFAIEYRKDLFKEETILRFKEHFVNLLREIAANSYSSIGSLDMLSGDERKTILNRVNGASVDYPSNLAVHQLFKSQVQATPWNSAIVYRNHDVERIVNYKELDELSNSLARHLRAKGVGRETIVAIMINQVPEMLIGILGILKAGGAFLPIDPSYGAERITYMIGDSGAKILLSRSELAKDIIFDGEFIDLENPKLYEQDKSQIDNVNLPTDMAYVIYTSGSTGRPKGVVIEHRSLINLCYWHLDYYSVDSNDRSIKYAGFGFDASVWEVFPYIIKGASIYLIDDELRLNIPKLKEFFNENKISIAFLPTQVCEQFMGEEIPSLKRLLTGGDKLRNFKASNYEVFNNYGPTENTVVTTSYKLEKQFSNIPIGKPIYNTSIYILDKEKNILPIGVVGEIYISGDGLARGYLNKPELTAESFVPSPFEEGKLMYKTGDLGKWNANGNIEFLGRVDSQVKIRGLRIELGEIETSIIESAAVKDAVVLLKEKTDGDKYLYAYFVPKDNFDIDSLRVYLIERLPEYMIPTAFVEIEEIPLTANGKVDKKALLALEDKIDMGIDYIPPQTDTEIRLAKIWSEVLGVERVGMNDNFYHLGGHSLKAPMISSKVAAEFGVQVPIGEIFRTENVRSLVEYIDKAKVSTFNKIIPVKEQEYYELSSAQKRLFVVNRLNPKDISYNMFGSLKLQGVFNEHRFEEAFEKLINRHDILRTTFHLINGQPVQKIHDENKFEIEYIEAGKSELKQVMKEFIRPFDLEKLPLIRVGVISLGDKEKIMIFDMHHIISDGVSMGIMLQDFSNFYNGKKLEELRIQYKDYAVWQNELMESEQKSFSEYSDKVLKNYVYTKLPNNNEGLTRSGNGKRQVAFIEDAMYSRISEFCKEKEITKSEFILSAFNIAIMNELGGAGPVTVGLPVAARTNHELEKLIGMFLNVLVVTTTVYDDTPYDQYLKHVHEVVTEALDNQEYPYEDLYYKARESYGMQNDDLFTIMFNYLPYQGNSEITLEGLEVETYDSIMTESKYEVTLYVSEELEGIRLDLVYREDLFQESMMKDLINNITEIISKILDEDVIRINQLLTNNNVNEFAMDFDDLLDNDEFFS